jgi:hypothetical protein
MTKTNLRKSLIAATSFAAVALLGIVAYGEMNANHNVVYATTTSTKTVTIDASTCPSYQAYSGSTSIKIGELTFTIAPVEATASVSFGLSGGLITFSSYSILTSPTSELVNGLGGNGYSALSYAELSGVTDTEHQFFSYSHSGTIDYFKQANGSASLTIPGQYWKYVNNTGNTVTFKSLTMSYSCVA